MAEEQPVYDDLDAELEGDAAEHGGVEEMDTAAVRGGMRASPFFTWA